MGAMATPFKGPDRENNPLLPSEVEEPQSEASPGKVVSIHISVSPIYCPYLELGCGALA